MDRSDFLTKGALRWCSLRPILYDTIQSDTVEKTIDLFIDQWLYFLPLPRYRPYELTELTDLDIFNCFLISIKKEPVTNLKDNKLLEIQNLFKKYWPHLEDLRDVKANIKNVALMICLMALDRESCMGLESKILFSDKFTAGFIRSISEEIKVKFDNRCDAEHIIQIMNCVHQYLRRKLEAAIPCGADDTWTLWSVAKDRGLTNTDIDERATQIIKNTSEKYFVAPQKLENRLAIKNFIDEVPEISYIKA